LIVKVKNSEFDNIQIDKKNVTRLFFEDCTFNKKIQLEDFIFNEDVIFTNCILKE
jgi:hypothetical protein